MRSRQRSILGSLACILVAAVALSPSSAFGQPVEVDLLEDPGEYELDVNTDKGFVERLTLPPVTGEMMSTIDGLRSTLSDQSQFHTLEILEDRSAIRVWWYGPENSVLSDALREADFPVSVSATKVAPDLLEDGAERLLEHADLNIKAVTVAKEGTGVEVALDDYGLRGKSTLAPSEFVNVAGVPVTISAESAPVPARQNDIYVMGGARVNGWNGSALTGGCTTGFPVIRNDGTGAKGMMFAAHCGPIGSQWVRWPNNAGSFVYAYGNNGVVSARTTTYDGAVIATTFNNPGLYTGPWDSTTYTGINGASIPVIGSEICYSGSYSGLVCGNIVAEDSVRYSLEGDLTDVRGYQTQQSVGIPAAGNGDSGGPGYMLLNINGTLQRRAALIISGIPRDSPPTCTGVAGGGPSDRRCSATVVATSAVSIGNALGWNFATTAP